MARQVNCFDVRKSTPFAATAAEKQLKAMEHGLRTVEAYVKGPGSVEAAIRSLQQQV